MRLRACCSTRLHHLTALRPGAAAVFTSGAQKLYLLVQDALSDAPCEAVAKTHALRTEADDVFRSGARIARCLAETYLQGGRLAGAAHALGLARAAQLRLWDASQQVCRQFDGIGKVHAAALAAAGYTSLDALDAADPRRLEAVAGRAYPCVPNAALRLIFASVASHHR